MNGMDPRLSFNEIAALYDKARPDYPDALFDDVYAAAGLAPRDAVLDVGCGSGQATVGWARRDLALTALDPGDDLLALARKRLAGAGDVRFVRSTFEAWQPPADAAFKLIASAQAWHWIAPEIGFAKAASLLAPGGSLAVFGNVPAGVAPPQDTELAEIYRAELGAPPGPPPEIWYTPDGQLPVLIANSGRFARPIHRRYAWSRSYDAAGFTDFLRTRTDHRRLPEAVREKLLKAIADAVTAHGDTMELRFETHLHLARRT